MKLQLPVTELSFSIIEFPFSFLQQMKNWAMIKKDMIFFIIGREIAYNVLTIGSRGDFLNN